MDKKIIGLDVFKLHGKDALTKSDDELYRKSVKDFVHNDMEAAKTLVNMFDNLKEKSEKTNTSYEKLVKIEFEKLLEGIYIDEKNKNKFIKFLIQNNILEYLIEDNRFIFTNYDHYKKAMFISQNLND